MCMLYVNRRENGFLFPFPYFSLKQSNCSIECKENVFLFPISNTLWHSLNMLLSFLSLSYIRINGPFNGIHCALCGIVCVKCGTTFNFHKPITLFHRFKMYDMWLCQCALCNVQAKAFLFAFPPNIFLYICVD